MYVKVKRHTCGQLRAYHKSTTFRRHSSLCGTCVGGIAWLVCCICIVALLPTTTTANTAQTEPRSVSQPSGYATSDNDFKRRAWPPLPHHDIWNEVDLQSAAEDELNAHGTPAEDAEDELQFVRSSFGAAENEADAHMWRNSTDAHDAHDAYRRSKVLHLFPVPVDGECLSDDGRRTGTCFNAYECRNKGGQAKGDCAMGFGVCCIFVASCNATISNNITYLVSPNFPSFMAQNFSTCSFKLRLMNEDISQLRFDFHHFSLGQPNRRTGVCDGDLFSVSGGLGGTLSLCGQNSGQHMYYDVGGRTLPRQVIYGNLRPLTLDQLYPNRNGTAEDQLVEITMSFTQRFLPIRLWEIRIVQIPFSQRAPAGCLQYHTGAQGVIQTFNFAENGRHLANQNYRICMRQEVDMCSIAYQPCDEQSFRIGPSRSSANNGSVSGAAGGGGMGAGAAPAGPVSTGINMGVAPAETGAAMPAASEAPTGGTMVTADDASMDQITRLSTTTAADASSTPMTETTNASNEANISSTTTIATTSAPSADDPGEEATSAAPASADSSTAATEAAVASSTPFSDDVEGSGGGENDISPPLRPSRRPRPVTGGFDLLGLLRSTFDFGFRRRRTARQWSGNGAPQPRQLYSSCNDRITMPCIVEDFIGMGMDALPGCEPVHCGAQFCSSGVWPCRIESTVTPFYIGVRFGNGAGKGSAEDNIGACLRYSQVRCM